MAYKTPGVYVEEITTFPPSVVPVETAIPAFVGYTEQARDGDGRNLQFIPTRIKSLLDFETYFGGDYRPAAYEVALDTGNGNAVDSITPVDEADNARRYYLYGCMRHFYANGGGPCYIVSVGSYRDAPALGNTTTPVGLLGGLSRLERLDEPTLLLFPDGVSLSASELGSLQMTALAQCEKLQDRFTIMDLREGYLATSASNNPITAFRQEVGINSLKYGAAYYPWVRTIYRPAVNFRDIAFFDTSHTAILESTLNNLSGDAAIDSLLPAVQNADNVVQTVISAVNIAAMAGLNPLTLTRNNFARLSRHCADLLELLRQTPATPVATVRQRFGNLLLLSRAIALAMQTLDTASSLPEELNQAISSLRQDNTLIDTVIALIALEKNGDVMGSVSASRAVTDVENDYTALNGSDWIAPHATVTAISANTDIFAGANQRETALNAASALQALFDKLAAAILSLFEVAEFLANDAQQRLFNQHPVIRDAVEQIKRTMCLLPAGGAVAGVYAAVDRMRGVWKAPANVSLADVVGPAVKINDQSQADLNVSSNGKSINAIRAFTGKGTLVWGARTLAGNDNEWRYVPVRRFFNMAEESIKKATEPFVFEPNDANTWIRVRAMIENFLTIQWRQGALAGATTAQAYYVKVGLGETMTAHDILEGRMIIEIGMAVVRPAEFIILRFAHKMQIS